MLNSIQDFLLHAAEKAVCGPEDDHCSKGAAAKQAPLKHLAINENLFSAGLRRVPAAESLLRVFSMLSGESWKNAKDIAAGIGQF